MSLGSWHGCSACFSRSPALPPPRLFLWYQQTARPVGKRSLRQCTAGRFLLPRATCHPDTAKVTPRPAAFPARASEPCTLACPVLINHFSSGAYSKHPFFCTVSAIPKQKRFKQRRDYEITGQQMFSKQVLPHSHSIL